MAFSRLERRQEPTEKVAESENSSSDTQHTQDEEMFTGLKFP